MDGEMPYMLKKNIAYKYKASIIMATGGSNCNCNKQEGGAKRKHTSNKKKGLSDYNIFMKTEIQNVKKNFPKLSHRQAFTKAAGNWSKRNK